METQFVDCSLLPLDVKFRWEQEICFELANSMELPEWKRASAVKGLVLAFDRLTRDGKKFEDSVFTLKKMMETE